MYNMLVNEGFTRVGSYWMYREGSEDPSWFETTRDAIDYMVSTVLEGEELQYEELR